ncbi:MAG: hypothetical protein RL701_713 [Pseudomonadota bacterium]
MAASSIALQLLAASCGGGAGVVADDASMPSVSTDMDHDGLCDATETELGTDPRRTDTDGDGIPDSHEAVAGSDPRSVTDLPVDHIAYFDQSWAEGTFEVSVTIDGDGSSAIGKVLSRPTLDPLSRRITAFYRGCSALSAEPSDNVREINTQPGRFGKVLGLARLRYELHFTDDADAPHALDCKTVLPFDFVVVTDAGLQLDQSRYMLVVGPRDSPFCESAACL